MSFWYLARYLKNLKFLRVIDHRHNGHLYLLIRSSIFWLKVTETQLWLVWAPKEVLAHMSWLWRQQRGNNWVHGHPRDSPPPSPLGCWFHCSSQGYAGAQRAPPTSSTTDINPSDILANSSIPFFSCQISKMLNSDTLSYQWRNGKIETLMLWYTAGGL